MSKLMSEGKVVQAACTSDAVGIGIIIVPKKPPTMRHRIGEQWNEGLRRIHLFGVLQ